MSGRMELAILGMGATSPYCDNCGVLTKDGKTPLAKSIIDGLVERGLLEPLTIYVTTKEGDEMLRASQQLTGDKT